ncbi:PREDICTED: probable inactive poly [ADP-ribose] polymerase SRO4 [Camelina sativa]|uniref:Probable inactive poly [ADP-ribose] polymerase SRO4 n=1 Tax=Camelina sativa TaxID=90675 RepID=A0ABM0TGT6_CAMSA|nr:PREDICTED: probable inactive poly [ADP-ribose] polymerase SRO4 [Camelina sativa]
MDYTRISQETPVNRLNHYEEEEGSTASSESRSNEELSDCDQQQSSSIAKELGLMELLKDDKAYELIYRHCQTKLMTYNLADDHFQIISILKNGFQTPLGQAKLKAFQIYIESVAKKSGSCCCERGVNKAAAAEAARVTYGCCSVEKEELKTILMYGFSHFRNNNGLYLSPDNAPLQCMIGPPSSSCDEDGMRFLLFSRIIMGKSEVVGSTAQSYPSSPEFDSGVDSLTSPKKYFIWSTHMNTHVLPEFVVCIKTPSMLKRKNPKSPWILFPVLIKSISKFLNSSQIRLIHKHYKEHQERRISRSELIQRLRIITGDRLLIQIIKSVGQKAPERSKTD